jgi:hypothetical protein
VRCTAARARPAGPPRARGRPQTAPRPTARTAARPSACPDLSRAAADAHSAAANASTHCCAAASAAAAAPRIRSSAARVANPRSPTAATARPGRAARPRPPSGPPPPPPLRARAIRGDRPCVESGIAVALRPRIATVRAPPLFEQPPPDPREIVVGGGARRDQSDGDRWGRSSAAATAHSHCVWRSQNFAVTALWSDWMSSRTRPHFSADAATIVDRCKPQNEALEEL